MQQVEAEHRPSRPCRRPAPGGRRSAAALLRSKTPMLSSPRKPPWKTLRPSLSLRLTHQVKFSSSLWKTALQEGAVARARLPLLDLVDPPGGPGVDRRVDVAEGPLVGRQLAVGVHVPLAQQQDELPLGEVGVDQGERDAVEGQVPGGEPGVLPLVRHRDDVGVVEVAPVRVAAVPALRRRRRPGRVAVQPALDVVVVELLGPDQPGERLPLDQPLVLGQPGRPAARRRRPPRRSAAAKIASASANGVGVPDVAPGAAATVSVAPGAIAQPVVAPPPSCRRPAGLTASGRPVRRPPSLIPSLTYGVRFRAAPQPLDVRLVLGEEQLRRPGAGQPELARAGACVAPGPHAAARHARRSPRRSRDAAGRARRLTPGPGVAEPEGRQQVRAAPGPGRGWWP